MRLFFSCFLDITARNALLAAATNIELDEGARWVPPENLHVTLAFIGEVDESAVPLLIALGASQRALRAELHIEQLVYWRESQAVVAAIHPIPMPLAALAERLNADRARIWGARRDDRPWAPHVTLARKVSQPPVFQPMSPISCEVRSFALMKSERQAARSVYTVVATWPLLDKSEDATKTR